MFLLLGNFMISSPLTTRGSVLKHNELYAKLKKKKLSLHAAITSTQMTFPFPIILAHYVTARTGL